jgi:hypothetical protein
MIDRVWDVTAGLAWGLWSELGVSSWRRSHQDWAVEVEPLIALTGLIGERDPRLLREAVDWCVTNQRFVSLSQLRRVVTAERWPFVEGIARFSATVGPIVGRRWPGPAEAVPYHLTPSGKSTLPDLSRPSLLPLRLRALFGVGARAEIIRVLLTRAEDLSVKALADRVAYTRRQIELDLEMLVLSGEVSRSTINGPATYALIERAAWRGLLGEMPTLAPAWAPIFRALTGLLEAAQMDASALAEPNVELQRRLRHLADPLERAGMQLPGRPRRFGRVSEMMEWTLEVVTALEAGDPSPLHGSTVSS